MYPFNIEEILDPDFQDAVLYHSLDDLVTQQETLLQESDLFRQAFESGLYNKRWKANGINGDQPKGRDGLRQLPTINSNDLLAMVENGRSIRESLLANPRQWLISRGTTGEKKWLPITLNDVGQWFKRIHRLNTLMGSDPSGSGELILAINEPKPKVSNAIPYLWEQVDYLTNGAKLEWIIVAMEMLRRNHWDKFVIQKQPRWIMSSVDDALRLADEMDTGGKDTIHEALPQLDKGIFWGAPLYNGTQQRTELQSEYHLSEIFELYFSLECREMYAECSAHDGLHLWMDGVIHEILLEGDETIFVDQASPGTEGEYIITALYEALPLIRYRTGDKIRVVSTSPCSCGITHPRVNFTGRIGMVHFDR